MAAPAYALQVSDQNLPREQWRDTVSIVQPSDAPIFNSINKGRATNVMPQFAQKDRDIPGVNINAFGDTYAYQKPRSARFASNMCQRFYKNCVVTREAQAVANVGAAEQLRDLVRQKNISLRTDFDYCVATAQGANTSEVTPISGGVGAFLTTNVTTGAGGATPGVSSSTHLPQSITAGTKRAFTKDMINGTMKSIHENGGMLDRIYMNLDLYEKVSTTLFPGDTDHANLIRTSNDGRSQISVTTSVRNYMSPTGVSARLEADRSMVATAPATPYATTPGPVSDNLLYLQPRQMQWDWLITPTQRTPGDDGDYDRRVIDAVGTLEVWNEKDHGADFAVM